MEQKYGGLMGDTSEPFVLGGNPLFAVHDKAGEAGVDAWMASQATWSSEEVAQMLRELAMRLVSGYVEHDHDHDDDDDDDVADEIDTDHRDTDIAAEAAIDEAIDEVAPELADDDTRPDTDTDTDTDDAPTAGDDPATEEEDD
jgi:hypothetical protein